ncbi:MucB/RseB C-terminal domain-containing protein [Ideonella sp.]|nr:MucB/RseB C-terminal domain-containing protein [Ideonella sp.]
MAGAAWIGASLAPWRVWPGVLVSCLLASGSAVAFAQAASDAAGTLDARAWLMRSSEAAASRNYQGTLVVSGGGSVSSSRVAHYFDGTQQYERVEALDGEPRSIWRHNDEVQTLWPRARVALIERRDPRATFPSLLSGSERRVLEWYELRSLGRDRVAGLDADVVLLKAKDSARFSQRLWAEHQTGLLLRAEVLGSGGQTLESAAFSELVIGVKPQPDQVLAGMKKRDGYRVLRPAVLPTSLDAEGWTLGALPAGFREVHCAKRSLDPTGAPDSPIVLQAIYSDGLTHVSVFIEPFQAERHQREVHAAIGATHTLMARRDDQWVTVMGDVPMDTLKRIAAALDHRR